MSEELTPYQTIRRQTICGRCKSSTFMFWDKSKMDTQPGGATYHEDTGKLYLVRCDYFRLTVVSPYALDKCEGFRDQKTQKKVK